MSISGSLELGQLSVLPPPSSVFPQKKNPGEPSRGGKLTILSKWIDRAQQMRRSSQGPGVCQLCDGRRLLPACRPLPPVCKRTEIRQV